MTTNEIFSGLQVIAVRYRGVKLAEEDERALNAYAAANVYASAGLPVEISEPTFSNNLSSGVQADDLGLFNGTIADLVAAARRAKKAILLTGGDCTHLTGIVGGLQQAHGAATRIGLVFFDAHGDYNTPQTTISGSLGGMPVAVCAGLAYPRWREGAKILAPIPPDRIVMAGLRNLDPAESQLIRATGVTVAAIAPGFSGKILDQAIKDLADRCDMIYLHIDADVLDEVYVPDHGTKEPNGPNMEQVLQAVLTVMQTGKVKAYAVVSIYADGPDRARNVASGIELIQGGLTAWRKRN
jgi:arginase